MDKVVTIPRELLREGDLVILPRSDYEEFLRLKRIIPLVEPSQSEKKAIQNGRKEIKEGEYLTLKQLKNERENPYQCLAEKSWQLPNYL